MTEEAVRRLPSRAGRAVLAISIAMALLTLSARSSAQCALCRDAVAASSTETREAMNYAIIGLALTPYGVAAAAAWALFPSLRAFVRTRLRRAPTPNPGETP